VARQEPIDHPGWYFLCVEVGFLQGFTNLIKLERNNLFLPNYYFILIYALFNATGYNSISLFLGTNLLIVNSQLEAIANWL
jgi:hypothetical protein